MSVESTNTPSGASKDLYMSNKDINEQQLAVTDMSQKDPEKDITAGNIPGDNTVTDESKLIDNSTAIRDFGSVRIGMNLIGQPINSLDPESKSTIKLSVEEVKKTILARGAISESDYIQFKKDRAERAKYVDYDKNNDEIDGRNQ